MATAQSEAPKSATVTVALTVDEAEAVVSALRAYSQLVGIAGADLRASSSALCRVLMDAEWKTKEACRALGR